MENTIISLVQNIFAEAFAFWFLVGFLLFSLGFTLLFLFILTRLLGYKTTGTVVGAILETRIKKKIRDGKEIEKIKKTLYPIYEYTREDGSTRLERGSEGGSMTHKYKTGQNVNLIIRQDQEYDDVYDQDEFGALYLGIILSLIGTALMVHMGSATSALGMSIFSLLGIIAFRLVAAFLDKQKTPLHKTQTPKTNKKHHKEFDPAAIKPIEFFKKDKA